MIIATTYILKKASLRCSQNKNVLVLGDSHLECAMNDTILNNYVNAAQSADTYLYSYFKLRAFVDDNPQIDTVLLAYDHSSMFLSKDNWINKEESILEKINNYYWLMNLKDCGPFLSRSSFYQALLQAPFRHWSTVLKFISHKKVTVKDLNIGGYNYLMRDKLSEDIQRNKRLLNGNNGSPDIKYSSYQKEYLEKIIAFCEERKIQLILVNAPTHHTAYNVKYKEAYYAYYKQNLEKVPLWDFSNMNLADSCFGDMTHLNFRGAALFSKLLKDSEQKTIAVQ